MNHLERNCEGLDASVFSSDMMYDHERYSMFKEYLSRWNRAVEEHDKAEMTANTPPAQPQRKPLTDEQKQEMIKKSELWDMHIHMGWYSAPSKSFVEKAIQLISEIEAAHGITKGQL
jgi:hypothetical protein